jgi:hypothetical protein
MKYYVLPLIVAATSGITGFLIGYNVKPKCEVPVGLYRWEPKTDTCRWETKQVRRLT